MPGKHSKEWDRIYRRAWRAADKYVRDKYKTEWQAKFNEVRTNLQRDKE